MRSSRAALVEHLAGTASALLAFNLTSAAKTQATGDMLGKVRSASLPEVELDRAVPEWLANEESWPAACAEEEATYRSILEQAANISNARERAKAGLQRLRRR